MEASELLERIGRGEDSRTQFKQTLTNPESLAGDLVAFANGKGGQLILGVNDQGTVVGLSAADIRRINQLLSNTATQLVRPSINPQTENLSVGGQVVMVVTVPEGLSKPYSDNGGVFWVKSGSDKRRVTAREEIQRMLQSAELVYADEVPVEGTSPRDLDLAHFAEFFARQYGESLDQALEKGGLPLEQLLHNLGLARKTGLNLAGLMLFGHHPQRHRPAFLVKAVSFSATIPPATNTGTARI